METITLGQLLEAVHGTLLGSFDDPNAPITGVDTDSRSMVTRKPAGHSRNARRRHRTRAVPVQ